jgi:hypothetical protein
VSEGNEAGATVRKAKEHLHASECGDVKCFECSHTARCVLKEQSAPWYFLQSRERLYGFGSATQSHSPSLQMPLGYEQLLMHSSVNVQKHRV